MVVLAFVRSSISCDGALGEVGGGIRVVLPFVR